MKQRLNYTIRIDILYRFSMIVTVRYVQYAATGRARCLCIIGRIADGNDLLWLQPEIRAYLQ